MIQQVGIVSKPGRSDLPRLLNDLLPWLSARGIGAKVDLVTAEYLLRTDGFDRAKPPEDVDLMIALGGDGTLLSVARGVGTRETPLLAVNLGGLGFMMSTGPEEIFEALESVVDGSYDTQERTVLAATVTRESGGPAQSYYGLNDIVVNKSAIARLLQLDAVISGELMCSYRADGLIISTPTGSTAYSLAAGGPILHPAVDGICITPICPHTLTDRPVVVPESSSIEIVFQGGDDTTYLTVDGQVGTGLRVGDRIVIRRAEHSVRIVQTEAPRFFDVLRTKMHWGGL